MEFVPRHQCFIYDGSPALNVPCIGNALREMLARNYRCLYLNSEPMLDAMRTYLAENGVNVEQQVLVGSLVLSSSRDHLMHGSFDLKGMLEGLTSALDRALKDDFDGLFATGDMSWEFGPDADFAQLMEYEWQLEEFFESHPQMSGICQYDAASLPRDVVQQGMTAHHEIFISEELCLPNPHFAHPRLAPLGGIRIDPDLA